MLAPNATLRPLVVPKGSPAQAQATTEAATAAESEVETGQTRRHRKFCRRTDRRVTGAAGLDVLPGVAVAAGAVGLWRRGMDARGALLAMGMEDRSRREPDGRDRRLAGGSFVAVARQAVERLTLLARASHLHYIV